MQVNTKIDIHNRFDFEVRDAITGELKQQATAYNIVLNQMYTQLVNFLTYHNNIHFGTGSGTLAATRTTLFTWLGQKASSNEELIKALPTSSWKKKIVLNPEEFVGSTITEVGIGSSATASSIVTHALLQDSEGNPISITKTSVDVVTIYATVYVTFSTPNTSVKFVGMPNANVLVNYLIGGALFPTCQFYAGGLPIPRDELQATIAAGIDPALGNTGAVTTANWTKDVNNRKATTPATRFATTVGNGHVAEMGFGSANTSPVFSSVLPVAGTFTGQAYTGVSVGTGNGSLTQFTLPSRNVRAGTITMKVDGTATAHTASASGFLAGVNPPTTMPGNTVLSLAWHTIGTDAYLAAGSWTSDATKFTWYKLVNGLLVAQTAPTTMPGNTIYFCAWHTIGSDTYLAVGSGVAAADRFRLYRNLNNITEITFASAPTGTITADYTVDGIHKTDQYVIDVSFALQYAEVTP